MTEQKYTPQTTRQNDLPPVEGRSDVAADLEEEQSNAYSAHHTGPAARTQKAAPGNQYARTPTTDIQHPVEGRSDVAADLDEEQRNAYSAHHAKASARENQGHQQAR